MATRDSIYALGLTAALLVLAACGSREPLRPPPGQAMPVAPATASRAPTVEELLTPTAIARPDRVGERLRRSERREDDRFDLPPP
jgi:predicted small lipoprotein YifL